MSIMGGIGMFGMVLVLLLVIFEATMAYWRYKGRFGDDDDAGAPSASKDDAADAAIISAASGTDDAADDDDDSAPGVAAKCPKDAASFLETFLQFEPQYSEQSKCRAATDDPDDESSAMCCGSARPPPGSARVGQSSRSPPGGAIRLDTTFAVAVARQRSRCLGELSTPEPTPTGATSCDKVYLPLALTLDQAGAADALADDADAADTRSERRQFRHLPAAQMDSSRQQGAQLNSHRASPPPRRGTAPRLADLPEDRELLQQPEGGSDAGASSAGGVFRRSFHA